MVDKLVWCFSKKEVKLIEPNENLAFEYLSSAEETLLVLNNIKSKSNMWLATTKYYCEYFASYSILMRLGIKCEIHDCTIEILKFLDVKDLLNGVKGFWRILELDKEIRIENQYYLKNISVDVNYNQLRDFVLNIKDLVRKLSNEEIEKVFLRADNKLFK